MPFPSLQPGIKVTDSFHRPNNSINLGAAEWTSIRDSLTGTSGKFQITGNTASPVSGGADTGMALFTGAEFPPDQYAKASISVAGGASSTGPGIIVRGRVGFATGGQEQFPGGYWMNVYGSGSIELWRILGGQWTTLATGTVSHSQGDIYELRAQGSSLSAFHNGAFIFQATDSEFADGQPGIFYSSTTAGANWNSFEAGSLNGGVFVPVQRLGQTGSGDEAGNNTTTWFYGPTQFTGSGILSRSVQRSDITISAVYTKPSWLRYFTPLALSARLSKSNSGGIAPRNQPIIDAYNGAGASWSANGSQSVSYTLTNRTGNLLVCGVSIGTSGGSSTTVSVPTCNGIALQPIAPPLHWDTLACTLQWFYLTNPPRGVCNISATATQVSGPVGTGNNTVFSVATTVRGVDASRQIGGIVSSTEQAGLTQLSVSLPSSQAPGLALMFGGNGSASTWDAAVPPQTTLYSTVISTGSSANAGAILSSRPTTGSAVPMTMGWTVGDWAGMTAIEILGEPTFFGRWQLSGSSTPPPPSISAALSASGRMVASINQLLLPVSDTSNVGSWTQPDGVTSSNLFSELYEPLPDDKSFAESPQHPSSSTYVTRLAAYSQPAAGPITLHTRVSNDQGIGQVDCTIQLMQGATVIQTFTHTNIPAGWTQFDDVVTGTITNWTTPFDVSVTMNESA